MTIILELTDAQQAALQQTLDSVGDRRSVESFVFEIVSIQANKHVEAWAIRKVEAVAEEVRKYALQFTEADLAEIKAVAEKYKLEPTPEEKP